MKAAFVLLLGALPTLVNASVPAVTYGTYFGGTGDTNVAVAVAVDPSGNVVVAGYTTSQTLPGTANAFQPTRGIGFPSNIDVFIAKFDPSGRKLLWTSYLGGDGNDIPTALAVDISNNIYVVGTTQSSKSRASGAVACTATTPLHQDCTLIPAGPPASSFVAKVSPDGRTLIWMLDLLQVNASAVAVDRMGNAYVGANGYAGMFLMGVNAKGDSLICGSFLGGGGWSFSDTSVEFLKIDQGGTPWVVGTIAPGGVSIPTTSDALQRTLSNDGLTNTIGPAALNNGFILHLNAGGSQVLYGTYFGPRYSGTSINAIVLTADGSFFFSGGTNAATFEATAGAYLSVPSRGFIGKLTPGFSALSEFSYLPSPPLLEVGNEPEVIYVTFTTPGIGPTRGFEVVELTIPKLALKSSLVTSFHGFVPSGDALSPPHSHWLAGPCLSPCSLGDWITADAFQIAPAGTTSAILIQVTDVSTNITSVVNAASYLAGPVAPGEIVTIGGTTIGPTTPATLILDEAGRVSTSLGGVQVLFNGIAAPLTYVSATQINCVVPYETQGLVNPYVQVSYQGQTSTPFPLVSTTAGPALFTANGSDSGPAAALNQDNSYNAPNRPAAKGSYVTIFVTGEGQTAPAGVTGKVTTVSPTPPLTPQPLLPVTVLINGQSALVAFYGEAPGLVSGVMQLNVQIPATVPSGNAPLQVSIGGAISQTGVTISVQ